MLGAGGDRGSASREPSSARPSASAFAAIPPTNEQAAEAAGVPTLRLKLIATTLSGALMGMAGAPLPYYVTYLDPASSFNLAYAVNSVAMPVIGGMTSWIGPVIGSILLARSSSSHGDHFIRANLFDRRPPPDRLRDHRAQRHRRAGRGAAGKRAGALEALAQERTA